MPRGRHWFGPGFWKRPGWYPGAGGFRGGAYPYAPAQWWGFYHPYAVPGPYQTGWFNPDADVQDERAYLREEAAALKAELAELERALRELEKSDDD